jgi:hypothetical protein
MNFGKKGDFQKLRGTEVVIFQLLQDVVKEVLEKGR